MVNWLMVVHAAPQDSISGGKGDEPSAHFARSITERTMCISIKRQP